MRMPWLTIGRYLALGICARVLYVVFAGLNTGRDVRSVLDNMFVVTVAVVLLVVAFSGLLPNKTRETEIARDVAAARRADAERVQRELREDRKR